MARSSDRTIRVGILCNGITFERWQAEAIRHAMSVQGVEICVLIIKEEAPKAPLGFWERQRKRHWSTALYRRYRQRNFRPGAMTREDLSPILGALPRVMVAPLTVKGKEQFTNTDVDRIRDHRVDVLLRFGFNILEGEILDLPTHGIWSFHHGDPCKFRGGPPGLWEIMKGDPVTGAVLQRLTDRLDAGLILREGWFPTIDHSLTETVDTVLMHTAIWPAQVMRAILGGSARASEGKVCGSPGPIHRYPENAKFIRFLVKQVKNKLAFHRRELKYHEDWNVGILYEPISTLVDTDPGQNVRWLPPPSANNFRADPFGYIDKDGQLNVLYEKYDHGIQQGEIARIRPKKDNVLKRSRTMLQLSTHLSYPYVVQQGDAVYVVPEQAAAGRVDLYRITGDNDALEQVTTLLNEPLFDPTLFEHEGRWWLLGTKAPLTNVSLHAYHSDSLQGPFVAHTQNPIKMDIRSARPGGTPFYKDGVLWRPGQDSSITYGGRIALNRVIELTPSTFLESTEKFIGPIAGSEWNKGLHTLCGMGDITLIDGKRLITIPERRKAVRQRKLDKLKQRTSR